MSKQIKGTVPMWLYGRYTTADLDRMNPDAAFNVMVMASGDMTTVGWTKVGMAEITVTLDNPAEVNAKQVAALRKKLTEMRAEHQQAQNLLTQRINELLAIDNEVTV